ncbi:MAG: flagellar hook-basal body complex protein FliE [Frankiaceae bacterium]|jgi:flagellar hook-basal body complex protein FliE|nr:flagellar hook-basal body complex protein FliE [Frankiaceae bacterium]MDQ1634011.1 flagellar hook-basal body complex protein FliE [Frankiaceae bacterium]MDQ1649308.1 flagellar hook-basal body complex protein FliE [Frankiaceae bacterium]
MSAIGGIGGAGFTPLTAPTLSQPPGAKTGATGGFQGGLDAVSKSIGAADTATAQVATGTATDLHAVTIAATKAQLGVTMTVALRNKAVEAYQEIMRMSV